MLITISFNGIIRNFSCNSYVKLLVVFKKFYSLTRVYGQDWIKVDNDQTIDHNGIKQYTWIVFRYGDMREIIINGYLRDYCHDITC